MSTQQLREYTAANTGNELTNQHERVLHRFFDEVYSGGNLQVVEELVAPDYHGYCSGFDDTYLGPSGAKRHATQWRAAIFGLDFEIHELHGSPNSTEVWWTASGRLERTIRGVQPRCIIGRAGEEPGGPLVTISGRTRVELTDGMVRRSDTEWNVDEIRDQVAPTRHQRTPGIVQTQPSPRNPGE